MKIGVPRESKNGEFRVGLTPDSVRQLVQSGHQVVVEHEAGHGIGALNIDYLQAGAEVVNTFKEVSDQCDMLVKVKEPSLQEASYFRENQIIFCYLHLAPNPALTQVLLDKKVIAVAFETITSRNGAVLLCPMSMVAGRMATQVGARLLERTYGGRGLLISGIPDSVEPAHVVVLGAGVVGTNAAEIAVGMGASVSVFDMRAEQLNKIRTKLFNLLPAGDSGERITTYSTDDKDVLVSELSRADIVIGSIYIPGALTNKLVTEEMVKGMKPGSVIVDVAIDQGGCFATSRPTSHSDPTYVKYGVVHYCVPNMPGAVPYTSTVALNKFLYPFASELADKGLITACQDSEDIRNGIHLYKGYITNKHIADTITGSVCYNTLDLLTTDLDNGEKE